MSITPEVQSMIDEAVENATGALKANNEKLMKELRNARAKVNSEIDPEAHTAALTKVDELTTQLEKVTKKSTEEIKGLTKKLEGEQGFTRKLVVDNGLTDAAIKAGVKSEYLPAVRAMLSGKVVVTEDGESRVAKIGDKTIAEYLPAWAQTDEGKHYIGAANNSGGGGQGGKGNGGDPAAGLKRSAMGYEAKAKFIGEHGQEKYNAIPL